jgi:hypothetical protein
LKFLKHPKHDIAIALLVLFVLGGTGYDYYLHHQKASQNSDYNALGEPGSNTVVPGTTPEPGSGNQNNVQNVPGTQPNPQPTPTPQPKPEPTKQPLQNVFPTGFENNLADSWVVTQSGSNTVATASSTVHGGSSALKLHYAEGNQPANVSHAFSSPQFGIVTIWFYDNLKNPSGSTVVISNADNSQVVSLGVNPNLPDRYFYRAAGNDSLNVMNSQIGRTKGWHKFELVSTDQGSYGKIDGISLAWIPGLSVKTSSNNSVFFGAVNSNLKGFSKIGIYASWGATGDYFWDDLSLSPNPEFASGAKNIDRYFLEKFVGETQAPKSSSLGYYRSKAVYALSLALLNRNSQDRKNAVSALNALSGDYSKWGKMWLSESITYTYALAAQRMWNNLDGSTKTGIQNVMASEAEFYKARLAATKDHPNDKDPMFSNGSTYIQNFSKYVGDTKSEEISNKASVLAAASLMFPKDARAKDWETAGKTYAFHSGSRGESYGGITSKNVYYGDKKFANYLVSNHNVTPYPSYAITGLVAQLANGALFYRLYGKSVPSEFQHNMTQVFEANQKHVTSDFQLVDQYINNDKDIFGRKDDWGLDGTYYTTGYAYECFLANKCSYKNDLNKYQITIARDYLAFPMDARVKMPWRGTEYTYEEKYWISGTNALAHATAYLFASL